MVVDESGFVHAAATSAQGVVYITNSSGSWRLQHLSEPSGDGADENPSIALDTSGWLAVAFDRMSCFEYGCSSGAIFLVTNESGTWSEPEQIASGDSSSLQLSGGRVHLAYSASEGSDDLGCDPEVPVRYLTNEGGRWTDVRVVRDGSRPQLRMGSDGRARIAVGNFCESLGSEGVFYAVAHESNGGFDLEGIPGTWPNDSLAAMVLDSSNNPHVIFSRDATDEGGHDDTYQAVREDGHWREPELVVEDLTSGSVAIDGQDSTHVLAHGATGVWYLTDRDGGFKATSVYGEPNIWLSAGDVSVEASGKPHLLFNTGDYEVMHRGLWFMVGPAYRGSE